MARVPGVRDGRVSAPYFEPSWATLASTGRQSTAWATQTARPTSAFDRAAPTASVACVGWQAASAQPLVGVPTALLSPLPPARGTPHTRPSSGAQGGTARSALASAHLAFTPATATKEVASAAQMKPVRLVWEPHAVPLSPALLTTPKPTPRNPSRPSLTSWWLASTEPSSFLTPCPRSNSRRPTSDHKKRPARAARAGERLASQPASFTNGEKRT